MWLPRWQLVPVSPPHRTPPHFTPHHHATPRSSFSPLTCQGPQHPSSLLAQDQLATCLCQQGDQPHALQLYKTALETSITVAGPHHPHSLAYSSHLGDLLDFLGAPGPQFCVHKVSHSCLPA